MKQFLVILLCLVASKLGAQTREMYPADRCNRIFISGLTSGITYGLSYSLLNHNVGYKKHLYPIMITMGANVALGALSYAIDNTNRVNRRQNITAWFGGSVVTIAVIRIGLN